MSKNFENGVKLYHSHRFEQALKELREAEKETAPTPELDYYIGLALTQLGDFEEALLSLEKVVTSHFSFLHIMQARMVLGYIYAITGRYKLAEFEFTKVNELGLQSSQALAALGYVFYCQKKIPESVDSLKKALEINLDLAVSLCRQASESSPKNPAYLDSLGWALFRRGDAMEAKACFRKALDMAPGNKEIAAHMRALLDATKQA
jgi:Flp pilus assembly protein TadD